MHLDSQTPYGGVVTLRWLTAFLDIPAPVHGAGLAFWAEVTGTTVSPTRGEHDEFVTLDPTDGDAYLRVQRVDEGPGGVHLDLHADDPVAFAWRAVSLGALEVATPEPGLVVLRSPGGFGFCVSGGGGWRRPLATPGVVDQVCLDVPPSLLEAEAFFWHELTLAPLRAGRTGEFVVLERGEGMPLRLMLQRLDDERPAPVTAHLDLAGGTELSLVVERHQALGALVLHEGLHWVTLRDPAGLPYCVTRRDPETGVLP